MLSNSEFPDRVDSSVAAHEIGREGAVDVWVSEQVAAAWSYTSGGTPRRVATLGKWAVMRAQEAATDAYYGRRGLRTTGTDLGIHEADSELMGYAPIRWRSLRGLFGNWQITPDDVLLDYGSGKGRSVIWAASSYRFRRIIGVELDPRLHRSAQANLARWNGPLLCGNVEFTCADATQFDVPDDVTVIYFYNPFIGTVFEKVLGKIQESLTRNPRELTVLYGHPRMHDSVLKAGFMLEREHTAAPNDWAIYRYPGN